MKYMAVIDADENPVSCEFIGCNGNVAPYLIGATTNIKPLEQESITWIVGKDNCQVAVRNMPIDKMQKICAIIGEEEK